MFRFLLFIPLVVASALPANARGYSFASRTQAGRGAKLVAAVVRELRGLDAVIAHQIPLYAIVVAPVVRPAGIPLVLWWSHWKMDAVVRLAEAASTKVVTVGPTTFPRESRKVVTIGQAIDVDRFAVDRIPHEGTQAVVIGRYSPAKGVDTIVRAVAQVPELRLDVYGPAPNDEARRERDSLERLVQELGVADRVALHGPLTRDEVVDVLRRADVLVNNAPGGADRIVYEAAAAGVPVLASNPAHDDLLDPEAFFARDDVSGLAAKLATVDRNAGEHLRARVRQNHSLESWADGLLRLALTPP